MEINSMSSTRHEEYPEKTHEFRQSVDRFFSQDKCNESAARNEPTISDVKGPIKFVLKFLIYLHQRFQATYKTFIVFNLSVDKEHTVFVHFHMPFLEEKNTQKKSSFLFCSEFFNGMLIVAL
jgi:hypothetical protein